MSSMMSRLGFVVLCAVQATGCHNSNVLMAVEDPPTTGGSAGSSTGGPSTTSTGTSTGGGSVSAGSAGSGSTTGGESSSTTSGGATTTGSGSGTTGGTGTTGGIVCEATLGAVTVGGICAPGQFCDDELFACCARFPNGEIAVDSVTGDDTTGCCGIGSARPCQTIARAISLIRSAAIPDIVVKATVDGGAGDWSPFPAHERYPIVLGWGVELSAPGVYFSMPPGDETVDSPTSGNQVFWIATYSKDVTPSEELWMILGEVGYASITGTAESPVGVGLNASDYSGLSLASVLILPGSTLYLANANLNTRPASCTNYFYGGPGSIAVDGNAALWLGRDHSGATVGTVKVGGCPGGTFSVGISCLYNLFIDAGCTIRDATMPAGQSSVVIQGQRSGDIGVDALSDVSLTSNPVFGLPPSSVGFGNCPSIGVPGLKVDDGIRVAGPAKVEIRNGTFQCIAECGLALTTSIYLAGGPAVTIDNTVIQNSDSAILAAAGSVAVTNSTIRYNHIGLWQATSYTCVGLWGVTPCVTTGTIDLGGGGNSVICSSRLESDDDESDFGMNVYNSSLADLNAANVAWDTVSTDGGIDHFKCELDQPWTACTCSIGACATSVPQDGAAAVFFDAGITTVGAIQAPNGCR
jgi:hypothetical protein